MPPSKSTLTSSFRELTLPLWVQPVGRVNSNACRPLTETKAFPSGLLSQILSSHIQTEPSMPLDLSSTNQMISWDLTPSAEWLERQRNGLLWSQTRQSGSSFSVSPNPGSLGFPSILWGSPKWRNKYFKYPASSPILFPFSISLIRVNYRLPIWCVFFQTISIHLILVLKNASKCTTNRIILNTLL